jgi:hypothetical protein
LRHEVFACYIIGVKIESIREVVRAQPFRPFWIYLGDGGRIPVEHEDFVAFQPSGREIIVYRSDDTHQILDTMLITRVEIKPANGARTKRKKQR